jgi:hypothetical protein
MSSSLIVPIVEGHGEVEAIPELIRRIFREYGSGVIPVVNAPIRVKAGSFLQDEGYFGRYIQIAAAKAAQGGGLVLILLDCEDSCAGTLGPLLLAKAQTVRPGISYVVALAQREYETWFLASAKSLSGLAGLSAKLAPPAKPESIRGAKEWLSKHMSCPYDPIRHQAELTKHFDLRIARNIPSFDRLIRRLTAN